jgi:hypothetical protein
MPTLAKSVFTGVDYIRLTANDHKPLADWEAIALPEFLREERSGRKVHQRWLLGYQGRVGEHVFVGAREDGCMIQMSGAYAWHRWYDATRHSMKCTRMDIQVTRPVEGDAGEHVRMVYEMGKLGPKREGRQAQLQITDTPEGAKMVTVGSRQSETYGRCYDKFRESKIEDYRGCVRWELECKGQAAMDLCAWMCENKAEPYVTRHIVREWWEKRGMPPNWPEDCEESMPPPEKHTRNDDTKIAWLAAQVRPSLQLLLEHGKGFEALRALLPDVLTDAEVHAILSVLTVERSC